MIETKEDIDFRVYLRGYCMKWDEAIRAADKCRGAAFLAKNPAFQDLWYDIADKLEAKCCVGQPWLRTYDERVK